MSPSLPAVAAALLCLAVVTLPARADALPRPSGEVILTVSGRIHNFNGPDGTALFDRAMLDDLAGREATMETPWTKGRVAFKGPLGRAILQAVGADGDTVKVVALNDYAALLPVSDFTDHDAILATSMNGKPMSVRDKGPVFVVYPFDKEPSLYNETYFGRSVWQVKAIAVQ